MTSKNLPPILDVYDIGENENLYLSEDYHMFLVADNGEMVKKTRY